MTAFNIGSWLFQIGWFWDRWYLETFLVTYEGEPEHHHRVVQIGPLVVSWEGYR